MGRQTNIDPGQYVAEQAAQWIVRLDSQSCSPAELEAFERWRTADPLHAAAYDLAERTWRDSNVLIRDSMALSGAARSALQAPPERRPLRRWWAPAVGLATAAAIAVAVFVDGPFRQEQPPVGTEYATAAGEQRTVTLADGSALTLDTRTVLVERFTHRERRVDLRQGQAQFEVQGDPSRPFVVHANGGTVTAIGTRFQVRLANAGTTVTLLKGVVHVASRQTGTAQRVVSLQPGQTLRIGPNGAIGNVQIADSKLVEGWTDGKLYVDDWRLQDFVAELNRYSDIQLRIDDPALREVRISGVFQTRNRDNLDRILSQGWGIHFQQTAPDQVVLSRQ